MLKKNIELTEILKACERLEGIAKKSPLEFNQRLSEKYSQNIYFKREDLQPVRSYKIRGAYNLIASLTSEEKSRGVVTASAGNHAQGFAFACAKLKIKGIVYMPEVTPKQKIEKVKYFGKDFVEIRLVGKVFDEASKEAQRICSENKMVFVHPFDDPRTIAGQATIGVEILQELPDCDLIVVPVGGGGLSAGIISYLAQVKSKAEIIIVDILDAPKLLNSIGKSEPVLLDKISTFVDGCAVKKMGKLNFEIINSSKPKIIGVDTGLVCTNMVDLYQFDGIAVEPAGAVSVSGLEEILKNEKRKNLNIVCVISGGNNDISRYPEILERSLIYKGLKHYFIVEFAQKPGELKKFLDKVLGENDDIVLFEYMKKTNKESGPALVGIESKVKEDYAKLIKRMEENEIGFREVTGDKTLFELLI